jgi:hypothetical protein
MEVPRKTEFREHPDLLQLQLERLGITTPSKLQRLQPCKTGVAVLKGPASDNTGSAGRTSSLNTQHPIHRLLLLSEAPNSSASSNHQNSNSLQDTICIKTAIKPQVS